MKRSLRSAIAFIRQGNWQAAHEIVQTGRDPYSCWIHGWLHRQEGDDGNARYWYSHAGKTYPTAGLDEELDIIACELKAKSPD